ncbi:methyl-accepting chemotaxis protein [Desulfovibrio ferrophilus]|nr:methyl-accepting chemotaxis protein [Desulfovibrio ferrophilus]
MTKVQNESLVETEGVMLAGYERTLQFSVETIASEFGEVVKVANEAGADPVEALRAAIKPVRFDGDGYYFIYNTKGYTVAHPLRPEFNDQPGMEKKDKKGNQYIKLLNDKAQAGGGFVTYWFNKPGEPEPSPKLAFAKMIPGTSFWVATGIYIDAIEAERTRINEKLGAILQSALTVVGVTVGIVFFFIVLPLSVGIVRSILRPLRDATAKAQEVAEGNLDVTVEARGRDEITRLEAALNLMLETLNNNIREIEIKSGQAEEQAEVARQAADEANEARQMAERAKSEGMRAAADKLEVVVARVAAASEEISAQSNEIRQGAELQSQRIAETATAMEEMNATVLEVARNSGQAAEVGAVARDKAQEGADTVEQSVKSMRVTQEQTEALKSNMDHLGNQANSIGAIMTVIEDIADQTNLLALNAAIEAARAGDAGRGFAVVADEVRKLAEKTMGATKEVGDSIRAIQDVARQNIESVDVAVRDLSEAVELSNKSGEMLGEIVNGVEISADQIQEIATAAEEQSATSEEINRSIDEINSITQETTQGVTQTAEAVQELTEQLVKLNDLIQELKEG